MCTYNGARFVGEQLASIAAQMRQPDELVVCDDCSTDATLECIREFARTAPFPVRVFENEKNIGSTKNFERAIELCEGDFIAFADQDDVWLPEKLRRLEETLANENAGLVFTDGEVVDESLRPLGQRVWQTIRFGEVEQRLFREGRAFAVLLDHNVVTGAAMALKAEFKKLILPFPDDLSHDGIPVIHDWWTALIIAAVGDVEFVSEPLFKYRQHAGQQMGVMSKRDERALSFRRNTFSADVKYIRAILERLSGVEGVRANVLPDLEARLTHLETRAAMPERRAQRIAPVLRELFARRYHLYSNGLASAARDFLSTDYTD
jgi:glycosyltransferase involved in cell wall biosynthesis